MTSLKLLVKFLPILLLSALLEAGGDAGMRFGLQGKRIGFVIGALALVSYGLVVNLPKWDFGKLMGVYIALFFVVSQAIALLIFKEKVSLPIVVGGVLIISGGLILSLWEVK